MSQPTSTSPSTAASGRRRRAQDDDYDEVENFHGVYLLCTTNPKYKGWTYIGYTVDPNRRIVQHNKGRRFGGAWRTSNRGPWNMVLVVHGFPNDVSALRFEWAWQHPERSRRLREIVPVKSRKLTKFQWLIHLLSRMLSVDPWRHLPLVIRWLQPQYKTPFPTDWTPPSHMVIVEGLVRPRRVPTTEETASAEPAFGSSGDKICIICGSEIVTPSEQVRCFHCFNRCHCVCLATAFLRDSVETDLLVPVEGDCPACSVHLVWGDVIKFKKGCFGDTAVDPSVAALSQP